MCTFIGVECVAANALIELYARGHREISFEELVDYGLLVVESYENEISERAVWIFDQERLHGMIMNYSNLFEIREEGEKKFICLREGADIRKVKEKFRWTLSYAMLKAVKRVDISQILAA